jgi:hypothetical protein
VCVIIYWYPSQALHTRDRLYSGGSNRAKQPLKNTLAGVPGNASVTDMPTNHAKMLSLHADALAVLDAIVERHGLRGHSEAVRHVLAALAPAYGCSPVEIVRSGGRPSRKTQLERRRAVLPNDLIKALPTDAQREWIHWLTYVECPTSEGFDALCQLVGPGRASSILQLSQLALQAAADDANKKGPESK